MTSDTLRRRPAPRTARAGSASGEIVGKGDLTAQTTQVLANIKTALAAAGAGPEHVVKWNLLVLEGQDLRQGFEAFQRAWGDRTNPPPLITGAFVSGLAHPDFLVEMDAIAIVPEKGGARRRTAAPSPSVCVSQTDLTSGNRSGPINPISIDC